MIDYPEPQRREILDLLFQPQCGAGFQHLKVEVGGDVNSTDGCEPSHMRTRRDLNFNRGYEWWLMREAHQRIPAIYLDCLQWGAPAWIGAGHLYSQDNAGFLARRASDQPHASTSCNVALPFRSLFPRRAP